MRCCLLFLRTRKHTQYMMRGGGGGRVCEPWTNIEKLISTLSSYVGLYYLRGLWMSAKLVLKDISNIVKSARVCAASSANSQPQKVIWQQQKKFPQSEASEIVSEPDNKTRSSTEFNSIPRFCAALSRLKLCPL
jgi:hypothetical protein